MEKNILINTDNDNRIIFFNALREVLEEDAAADADNSKLCNMSQTDIVNTIKSYQAKLRQTVPIPRSKEDEKRASLIYLDKIRAAAQICLLYVLISPEDVDHRTRLEFAGSLRSANSAIFDAVKHLKDTYRETSAADEGSCDAKAQHKIRLEDAWNKILEYDKPEEEQEENITTANSNSNTNTNSIDNNDAEGADRKKLKKSAQGKPLALRAKILLSAGRKLPSNLLDALKRKEAILCQDCCTPYLKLKFGDAFEMLIYFSPLLVRIRAIPATSTTSTTASAKGTKTNSKNLKTTTTTPIAQGREYHIMGVRGDIKTVGPLIVQRLEFASAQATRCLRRCFADLACRSNSSDFETEISEGNALLRFLNLARNTHCPNWTDAC